MSRQQLTISDDYRFRAPVVNSFGWLVWLFSVVLLLVPLYSEASKRAFGRISQHSRKTEAIL